jgi:hypothetical protein
MIENFKSFDPNSNLFEFRSRTMYGCVGFLKWYFSLLPNSIRSVIPRKHKGELKGFDGLFKLRVDGVFMSYCFIPEFINDKKLLIKTLCLNKQPLQFSTRTLINAMQDALEFSFVMHSLSLSNSLVSLWSALFFEFFR